MLEEAEYNLDKQLKINALKISTFFKLTIPYKGLPMFFQLILISSLK